jgi:hypothetical protein
MGLNRIKEIVMEIVIKEMVIKEIVMEDSRVLDGAMRIKKIIVERRVLNREIVV